MYIHTLCSVWILILKHQLEFGIKYQRALSTNCEMRKSLHALEISEFQYYDTDENIK